MIKRRHRATQKHVTSSYVFCCVCALNVDFHQHGFWISRKTDSLEHTTYCACKESPHLFTLNENINKSNNYIVPPANNRLTETDKKDKPKLYKKKRIHWAPCGWCHLFPAIDNDDIFITWLLLSSAVSLTLSFFWLIDNLLMTTCIAVPPFRASFLALHFGFGCVASNNIHQSQRRYMLVLFGDAGLWFVVMVWMHFCWQFVIFCLTTVTRVDCKEIVCKMFVGKLKSHNTNKAATLRDSSYSCS